MFSSKTLFLFLFLLSSALTFVVEDEEFYLNYTVVNNFNYPIKISTYGTPFGQDILYFKGEINGTELRYQVEFHFMKEETFFILMPKESKTTILDLGFYFDLSAAGSYRFWYRNHTLPDGFSEDSFTEAIVTRASSEIKEFTVTYSNDESLIISVLPQKFVRSTTEVTFVKEEGVRSTH